jgi:PAS domain S-box-containing protein
MIVDNDPEILRLRAVLRDMVALSTIPVTWIGCEPPDVAARLADTLIGLLQLDFAFVRLCDPGGGGAVDVVRGNAWPAFPEWLEHHLATKGRLSGKEIVSDIAAGEEPRRGVVIPIGVNAEGGLAAASRGWGDFPTELDQLLLTLSANHAAAAFQSARLIHERRTAEEDLREARDELEVKVAARTAALRRSEAYLAEAQRLTHTGSFALNVPDGEPTHSSDEHSRLYGFDPDQGIPSLDAFIQRIHPDDRARCAEALETAIREAASFEIEHRVGLPRGQVRHIRALAHPVVTAAGELEEFVGTVVDVTDEKRAEEERRSQLWFFESMDGINRAMQGARDLEQMMGDVLDVALTTFGCDRAWLIYPCDPEAASHRVRVERTLPEYVGAVGLGVDIPNDPEVAGLFRMVLASGGPVRSDPESGRAPPSTPAERFAIKSQIAMAVYPKVDKPYMFGLHQCSHPRVWTAQEERLFEAIGRRLADALDTLTMFRDLRDARQMVEASRDELRALADEQAALRRVATLVARGVPPPEVFAAVARELGLLVGVDATYMARYEPDGAATGVAAWNAAGDDIPVGTRVDVQGPNVAGVVLRTGRPARMHDSAYASGPAAVVGRELSLRSSVGAPIVVDERLWGVMIASSDDDRRLPADAETRIAAFTELVATALSNVEARTDVQRLGDEQAALRRVATLVASEPPPAEVFTAVAEEVSRLLGVDGAALLRYEPDRTASAVASSDDRGAPIPVGTRVSLEADSVARRVQRTRRLARIDDDASLGGALGADAQERGIRSGAGAPILVDGRLWGVIVVGARESRLPADTAERIAQFTDLVATAISNAEARRALAASRARIVAAADDERRRVVRDLHDGAQQRLVHTIITLKLACGALEQEQEGATALVAEALGEAERANVELRELVHGILPAALTHGGLGKAVAAVASRMPVPVQIDVSVDRLSTAVEATAYFVVAEALTNVAKHARAGRAEVTARIQDGTLGLQVRDDGVGGARPGGSGLTGLADRLAAVDGELRVESPAGGGTLVAATIPLAGELAVRSSARVAAGAAMHER